MPRLVFQSTKTYVHSEGLSCVFRQWKATHSHCSKLHGYALEVKITFECLNLDENNWCVDFGGLKDLKEWLHENFDHKVLVSQYDPLLDTFKNLYNGGLIDLNIVQGTGCENFAEMIYAHINDEIIPLYGDRVILRSVEVKEHEGNSALLVRQEDDFQ